MKHYILRCLENLIIMLDDVHYDEECALATEIYDLLMKRWGIEN